MSISPAIRASIVLSFAFTLSACSGLSNGAAPGIPSSDIRSLSSGSGSGKIQHVVIIVQENRSFNDLFYGFKGATTAKDGYDSNNQKITLQPIGLETRWDITHDSWGFEAACNGTGSIPGTNCRMNGFNKESWGCTYASGSDPCPIQYPPYAYVPHTETAPYFAMAKQYVLADQMYPSNFDGSSFISHQYIISGQAEHAVNYPYGAWGCPGGSGDNVQEVGPDRQVPYGHELACWNPTTLGDELDSAGISWGYYAVSYGSGSPGIWSAYQAIQHIYEGQDWKKNVISPPSKILTDAKYGGLRTVSWVTPTCANSDHAGCGSKTGPSWVASIVNAIGESKYWDSTAIFLFWDDYGGWYDPEPPAYVDYDGLGMRIPMVIISPYARKGHISEVHYEHGSILRFVEDLFGLGQLSASDTRATSPAADCFDFNQTPRKFKKISAPLDENFFLHQKPDHRIPDAE
jgi:phospholipase C